jgi:hypothetical protein
MINSRLAQLHSDRFEGFGFVAVGYLPPDPTADVDKMNAMAKQQFGYELFGYQIFHSQPDAADIIEAHVCSFATLASSAHGFLTSGTRTSQSSFRPSLRCGRRTWAPWAVCRRGLQVIGVGLCHRISMSTRRSESQRHCSFTGCGRPCYGITWRLRACRPRTTKVLCPLLHSDLTTERSFRCPAVIIRRHCTCVRRGGSQGLHLPRRYHYQDHREILPKRNREDVRWGSLDYVVASRRNQPGPTGMAGRPTKDWCFVM